MAGFIKHENGMTIFGQGTTIMRISIPFIIIAVVLNIFLPEFSALPAAVPSLKTLGIIWLIAGLLLWIGGLVQLLLFFPKGKLVKTGTFAVCRNPIYASYIVFILPAVTMLTMTWVYLVPAVIMYIALRVRITKEENDLVRVFGDEYVDYMKKVPRTLPLFRKLF